SKGRPVAGLRAGDFRVFEKGRLQAIKSFGTTDGPASIGLIIDNSGSMQNKHTEVVKAALAFVGESHPDDEMFVVDFNERVSFGLPPSISFTNDRGQVGSALIKS